MASRKDENQQEFQRFANKRIVMARKEKRELFEDGPIYMVRKFIDAQRRGDGKGFTDWDVASNSGQNIGAGSDSTALSLSTIIYYIYQSPRVLERIRKEIDSVGLTSTPTFQIVQQMPYLQAVIKESLRMNPATGFPLWREIPKGGAVVSGQFFPEGVYICLFIFLLSL